MKQIRFQNHDCFQIETKFLELVIAESIGPRILSLKLHGKDNIFAELPGCTTSLPDSSNYHFWGGHRLWIAPEQMPLTYDHDDQPVKVFQDGDEYLIMKDVEKSSGIQKTIRIKPDPDQSVIQIRHQLHNFGNQPVACAAWAITQFKPGGVAILPQTTLDTGLLPNRSFSLWPYSNIQDGKVTWGNDCILLDANLESPFKIGFPNQRGWLGYWLDGTLFVKTSQYFSDESYFDNGSSSECYCNDQFLELETLGPKTNLEPGRTIEHKETWKLFSDIQKPSNFKEINFLISLLHLEF